MELATRLSQTGHECRLSSNFQDYGLAANITLSHIDVGFQEMHPILSISDTLQAFGKAGKQDMVFTTNTPSSYEAFWKEWKKLHPDHALYDLHQERLGSCIPIAIHLDEGTTLKKKSILVIQWQPVMGRGTRRHNSTVEIPGCNLLGDSLTTRFLWSVMLARLYSGKKKPRKRGGGSGLGQKPLQEMFKELAKQLTEAFTSGIDIQFGDQSRRIFLVCVAIKGDWPALCKVGNFSRHFGRVQSSSKPPTAYAKPPAGICHLCKADQDGFKAWNDVSWSNMTKMHKNPPLPWDSEPHLASALMVRPKHKAQFFKVDLFHTLHKGVFADIAANTIATWFALYLCFACSFKWFLSSLCCFFFNRTHV